MNIREIAKKANVSTATVSRVLNGNPKVGDAIKKRVQEVIDENNYVPNAIARSMNDGKTSIIGLVLPDITNPFFPGLSRGVEDAASALGYKIILCNTDNHNETEESYLQMLREQRVEGLVLISSSDLSEDRIHELIPGIPVVWCDRLPKNGTLSSVITDHEMGIRLAVKHLISLGHQEIGMITGPRFVSATERTELFKKVLQEEGVLVQEDLFVPGDYGYESGFRGMKKLLHAGRVTAVFCANDLMAFGAMEAAFDSGLKVPEDLSVIGYDNISFSNWSRPALTTVSQPTYLLGMTALKMVVDELEGKQKTQIKRLLEPTLIVRKSTARVNS